MKEHRKNEVSHDGAMFKVGIDFGIVGYGLDMVSKEVMISNDMESNEHMGYDGI